MKNNPDNIIVSFRNIYKSFGTLCVLQDFSLDIFKEERLVVMGPSGTGKTVMLKHIIGLLRPDSGEIYTLGKNVNSLDAQEIQEMRKKISYVFQLSALFDSMTVGENVAIGLIMHSKLSREEIKNKVTKSLGQVGLEGIENKKPEEISGGMKKRVAIARAIALDPVLLLYDEPTSGLDPSNCKIVNQLIKDLNDQLGVTSVVVTHDIQSALTIADRIVLYNHGKIIAEGKPNKMAEEGILHRFIQGEKI